MKEFFKERKGAYRELIDKVRLIVKDVKERGDESIREFYEEFYGISRDTPIKVSSEEIREAEKKVEQTFKNVIEKCIRRVRLFARKTAPPKIFIVEVEEGMYAGQLWIPYSVVGAYIPHGRAPYVSTAIMTVAPASEAGVEKVVACTPPGVGGEVNPYILYTLYKAGASEIYRVGGAHAIAAMAYGTDTIPKVEKILGPGGAWASLAKLIVRDDVAIDFYAGPTENFILADQTVEPSILAIDFVSQCEHDPLAQSILAVPSEEVAEAVVKEVSRMVEEGVVNDVAIESLSKVSFIVVYDGLSSVVELINKYAPEHLQLAVKLETAIKVLRRIRNVGSIFIGVNTPVALGDYAGFGTNHVLPTNGYARFRGGLSILDYGKLIDIQLAVDVNKGVFESALKLAELEGFLLHKLSIQKRLGGGI